MSRLRVILFGSRRRVATVATVLPRGRRGVRRELVRRSGNGRRGRERRGGSGLGTRYRGRDRGHLATSRSFPRPAWALRQGDANMDESLREREQRAARNQLLFREVNERIASLAERALLPEIAPIEVTCECVDMSCTRTVQISLHEFAEIDRATNRFLVVPGHELPDVEDVVERRDRFLIVAKRGAGADLVEGSANLRRRIELHHESANSSAA